MIKFYPTIARLDSVCSFRDLDLSDIKPDSIFANVQPLKKKTTEIEVVDLTKNSQKSKEESLF